MKPTSKELLEEVSKNCSNELTLYTFNKSTLIISDKYREGRLTGLNYIGDLTFHFLQEEKQIQERFKNEILKQMKFYVCLAETEYKQGLYDSLKASLKYMNEVGQK